MTNAKQIANAIVRSSQYSEIVALRPESEGDRAALCEILEAAADGSAEADAASEYWGESDGSEWRVHVRRV